MNYRHFKILILIIIFQAFQAQAQLTDQQKEQIDSLFVEWNQPNHPGGAVGVMQDGQIVFSKAYGLASLEYLAPNTTGTLFNVASVSKQFTAMGIVLLDIQGKLSIDDEIHKHLPWLPDFGEKITLRHMMNHTSGMRSLHALLAMAGWRGDDSRTNADLNRLLLDQVGLNFKPGAEYLYCNTGFMLLADVIEVTTDESFPDWMKTNVFEPLGMINTYVEDDYARVVHGNATSYNGSYKNGFSRAVEYWGYVGSGNIHSSTGDLLQWMNNFVEPSPGWEEAFDKMQVNAILNNGESIEYALGVNVGTFKGTKRVQHGGSIGGFRAQVASYPDEKLTVAIITNFSSSGVGGKAATIADLLISNTKEADKPEATIKAIALTSKQLEQFEGHYWSEGSFLARKINLKNDTLRYSRSENNESLLVPTAANQFQMVGAPDVVVSFESEQSDEKSMKVVVAESETTLFESYTPFTEDAQLLTTFIGNYFSPELKTSYRFFLKEGKLMANHTRHGDIELKVIKNDVIEGDWPINFIKVKTDKKGRVQGISVTNGRVRNLWFEKTK